MREEETSKSKILWIKERRAKGWYKKERRQDRDGECRELIDGVVSEELGVPGVITPPLYCRIGAEPNVNTTASTGMLRMSFYMSFMYGV